MLQPQVAPEVLTLFDAVMVLGTVVGIVLSLIAICLAYQADKINKRTSDLLLEIRAETKAITSFATTELQAYGKSMRAGFARNQLTSSGESKVISPELEFSGSSSPSASPSMSPSASGSPSS
jgi:hypothetical protein